MASNNRLAKIELFKSLDKTTQFTDGTSTSPTDVGTRIYSRTQREYGISQGQYGEGTHRISVLWSDGKVTHPHLEGIFFVNQVWKLL